MPPDISGVGATSRLLPSSPIGPAVSPGTVPLGPVGPVTPTTALAPVGPVGPRGATTTSSPLGRSGLDLLDVLGTTDVLLERGVVAPVALEAGLETARGALLRGLGAESLATLDGVWERAQLTEEGWYLRSGALTVLGLPGEAERVSSEALQLKPSSVALRFMQSLARLASGDLSGARSALAAAIDPQSPHPVLLLQQVIVVARQGHRREAERLLQQAMRVFPDHPAVDVARATLRSIAAEQTRSTSRDGFAGQVDVPSPFTTGDHEAFEAFSASSRDVPRERGVDDTPPSAGEPADARAHRSAPDGAGTDDVTGTVSGHTAGHVTGQVVERAMARLGARFATLSVTDAVREGRVLIRAFSAGGSMAGACSPEQAHAARGVLTAIVFALTSGPLPARAATGGSPLEVLLSQWLPLMQAERFDDAARVLRRLGAAIPDAQRRLLAACSQMPFDASLRDEREPRVMSFGAGEYDALGLSEPAKGPLIPVRLGLALLEERAPERSNDATRAQSGWIERPHELTLTRRTPARVTPHGLIVGSPDADGRGWAAAAGAHQPPPRDAGAGMRIAALLCVVVAAGAATSGSGVVAIAFGVGAAWLGLRRSSRSGERSSGTRNRDTTGAD